MKTQAQPTAASETATHRTTMRAIVQDRYGEDPT